MPVYLGALTALSASGSTTASSEALARACGVGAAIVRRDLSLLDHTGRRGVGYDVSELAASIRRFLGIDRLRPVGIVGTGRLGTALAHYLSDPQHGFAVRAVFDSSAARIGQPVVDLAIRDIRTLPDTVRELSLELLVIAVAQSVVDAVVDTDIRGLLNFAPVPVRAPPDSRSGTSIWRQSCRSCRTSRSQRRKHPPFRRTRPHPPNRRSVPWRQSRDHLRPRSLAPFRTPVGPRVGRTLRRCGRGPPQPRAER